LSSILKALQRLQGDRGDGALPEPQPALGEDLARELAKATAPGEEARSLSRARLTLLGVAAAALLLAMAGLGWWLARGMGPETALPAESAPPLASAEPPPEPAPPSGTLRKARPARPSASPEEAPTLPASLEPAPEEPAEVAAAPAPGAPVAAAPAPPPAAAAPRASIPAAAPVPAPAPAEPSAQELAAREPVRARAEAPRIELAPEEPARAESAPARAAPGKPSSPAAPPVAAAPRAEPRAGLAPPAVEVLRTTWHPHPERRVARIRVAGFAAPVEVREGDAVSTLVVKTIEPSGVLFLHGGEELRRSIGKP